MAGIAVGLATMTVATAVSFASLAAEPALLAGALGAAFGLAAAAWLTLGASPGSCSPGCCGPSAVTRWFDQHGAPTSRPPSIRPWRR